MPGPCIADLRLSSRSRRSRRDVCPSIPRPPPRPPAVYFLGEYRVARAAVLGTPRLTLHGDRPCGGGLDASIFSTAREEAEPRPAGTPHPEHEATTGEILMAFERTDVDRLRLLRG